MNFQPRLVNEHNTQEWFESRFMELLVELGERAGKDLDNPTYYESLSSAFDLLGIVMHRISSDVTFMEHVAMLFNSLGIPCPEEFATATDGH